MASVNFLKLHNSKEAGAIIRHCDRDERIAHEHSNKQINKDKTSQNLQLKDMDFNATMLRFNERIKQLDKTTNTNKRKDRVELFALETTVPNECDATRFALMFKQLLEKKYGKENLINVYTHFDECHPYFDKQGEMQISKVHIHAFVVPEVNGKLCGKEFSSRKAMKMLNQEIQKYCKQYFDKDFLKYNNAKEHKKEFNASVEELKAKSMQEVFLNNAKNKAIELIKNIDDDNKAYQCVNALKSVLEPEKAVSKEHYQSKSR